MYSWLQFSTVSVCYWLYVHTGKDDDNSLSKAVDSPDLAGDDSTTHTQ